MLASGFLAAHVREAVQRAVAFLREHVEDRRWRWCTLNILGYRLESYARDGMSYAYPYN